MATGTINRPAASLTEGLRFAMIGVNDTTDAYGQLDINNTIGTTSVYLLRNTYYDGVSGSFGVINVEAITASSIKLRFRTLSDGAVNANKLIQTGLVFAYS